MLKSNGAGGADGMQLLEYAVKGEGNNQGLFLSILILAVDNNRYRVDRIR
ncbi:hypothetical protein H206_02446 [Candidatus Electrothrix aarhusensis]|uniref:Uncharacterized protein n=1 Tax=Candidatus Electrothrix aarhusensis TaxID=1859131 RepID=A0A3S3QPC5_9BACT|nr:hypothetical protein H206_02446 [Candidatus Electrothrix aarhusensis]